MQVPNRASIAVNIHAIIVSDLNFQSMPPIHQQIQAVPLNPLQINAPIPPFNAASIQMVNNFNFLF